MMGMFDTIILPIKCPFCGQVSDMECQTKDMESMLEVYYVGDYVGDVFVETGTLRCITECQSEECSSEIALTETFRVKRGKYFDLQLRVENGEITGEYKIIENL